MGEMTHKRSLVDFSGFAVETVEPVEPVWPDGLCPARHGGIGIG